MIVNLDNKKYVVKWRYEKLYNGELITQCYISPEGQKPLYYGVAKKVKEDNHNKHIGRKLSLARAIQSFDRNQRKVFWEAYLKNCRIT
jgi:hypothetical protein